MRSQFAAVPTARPVRRVAEVIKQERRIGNVAPVPSPTPGEHHAKK
jgi:hypothetical protein